MRTEIGNPQVIKLSSYRRAFVYPARQSIDTLPSPGSTFIYEGDVFWSLGTFADHQQVVVVGTSTWIDFLMPPYIPNLAGIKQQL